MNYIDIIILIPLLWAAYRGFSKGFVIEVVSILAFGLGIWGGIHFSDLIAGFVKEYISTKYEPLISFTLLFIGIVIAIFVLGKALEKLINIAQLKLVNKISGGFFGALKVALVVGVLIVIIEGYDNKFGFIPKETKQTSLLYVPFVKASNFLIPTIEESKTFNPSDWTSSENEVAEVD